MTAHPKTCPTTGELHFFGYGGLTAPFLTYHRADAAGELTVSRTVDVPAHSMMHDFHLTSRHVVLMDLPVLFDVEKAMSRSGGMPYSWTPEAGARLGVLRRDDPYGEVRWFEIEPCYVFHTLNAHEEGDTLVLYGMRYDSIADGARVAGPSTLWRWTVDLGTGTVSEQQLDDRKAEFPRIDDRLAGLATRYGVAVTAPGPSSAPAAEDTPRAPPPNAVHRYDLVDGSVTSHVLAPGRTPGEACFVPADDTAGGPGWLMTFVHDAATDRSDLVVLDADHLAAPPVATVHLPRRVPFGFHGNWLSDA